LNFDVAKISDFRTANLKAGEKCYAFFFAQKIYNFLGIYRHSKSLISKGSKTYGFLNLKKIRRIFGARIEAYKNLVFVGYDFYTPKI
jgi:hypothetical protein